MRRVYSPQAVHRYRERVLNGGLSLRAEAALPGLRIGHAFVTNQPRQRW
jgi:hypothetical protein